MAMLHGGSETFCMCNQMCVQYIAVIAHDVNYKFLMHFLDGYSRFPILSNDIGPYEMASASVHSARKLHLTKYDHLRQARISVGPK